MRTFCFIPFNRFKNTEDWQVSSFESLSRSTYLSMSHIVMKMSMAGKATSEEASIQTNLLSTNIDKVIESIRIHEE